MAKPTIGKPEFRPDIEGLRGIAILPVPQCPWDGASRIPAERAMLSCIASTSSLSPAVASTASRLNLRRSEGCISLVLAKLQLLNSRSAERHGGKTECYRVGTSTDCALACEGANQTSRATGEYDANGNLGIEMTSPGSSFIASDRRQNCDIAADGLRSRE